MPTTEPLDYDIQEDYYDPEESIVPSRLFATTRAPPPYIAGQQGSAGGRIVDPRGGMANVRFNEPVVRMRDFREAMARVQMDVSRLSGMIRGLNQTIASQASTNTMMSLFSLILGGPKLDSVIVENITTPSGPVTSLASGSSTATTGTKPTYFPATVDVKETKYKLDIMTLLPMFMLNMGGQSGGPSTGGGMFGGGSNFMMMFILLILMKTMNEDK